MKTYLIDYFQNNNDDDDHHHITKENFKESENGRGEYKISQLGIFFKYKFKAYSSLSMLCKQQHFNCKISDICSRNVNKFQTNAKQVN